MKKKIIYLGILTVLISVFLSTSAFAYIYARVSSYASKYILTTGVEQEENSMVLMTLSSGTTATSTDLIDLSNRVMFPHPFTGELRISRIDISWEVDPNSVASTTLKFGVMASTTATGDLSDIKYFDRVDFSTDDGTYQRLSLDYSPSLVKLGLNGATTTSFVTNDTLSLSSLFATTTAITSPLGVYTVKPDVGDLIMSVYKQNGTATTTIKVFYHVK